MTSSSSALLESEPRTTLSNEYDIPSVGAHSCAGKLASWGKELPLRNLLHITVSLAPRTPPQLNLFRITGNGKWEDW